MMSIQTPLGVFSSTRLLQGGNKSGNHFQAKLRKEFERIPNLLQWLDDFLLYCKEENELLSTLDTYIEICANLGIKIHAGKSILYTKEAHFCGRLTDKDGVRYCPRHFESLITMKPPTRGDELYQFISAANWMRSAIPNYAEGVAPLHPFEIERKKEETHPRRRSQHLLGHYTC